MNFYEFMDFCGIVIYKFKKVCYNIEKQKKEGGTYATL